MDHKGINFVPLNTVEYFDSPEEALEVALIRGKKIGEHKYSEWSTGTGKTPSPDIKCDVDLKAINDRGWIEGGELLNGYFEVAAMSTLQTSGSRMKMDYAGSMPCVPTYLSGDPMHMRRKVRTKLSKAPLTIVIGNGSSGGVSNDFLVKRGAAISCLIMYLSTFRAVTVYSTCALEDSQNGYYFSMIKIGTSPFDMSQLAFQLAHPASSRALGYLLQNYNFSSLGWAKINGESVYGLSDDKYNELVKPVLGLNDEDIIIREPTLDDYKLSADPVQWAKDRVKAMGYEAE